MAWGGKLVQRWVRGWCCPNSHSFWQGRGQDSLCCEVACTNGLLFPPRRPWLPAGNGKCPPPRSPRGLRHTLRGSACFGLNWECCRLPNWFQSHCTAGWHFVALASLGAELSPLPAHAASTHPCLGWGSVPGVLWPLGPQRSAGGTPRALLDLGTVFLSHSPWSSPGKRESRPRWPRAP